MTAYPWVTNISISVKS